MGRDVLAACVQPNSQGQSALVTSVPGPGNAQSGAELASGGIAGFRVFPLSIASFGTDYMVGNEAVSASISSDNRYAVTGSGQGYTSATSTGYYNNIMFYSIPTIVV
jgi:hypothetical protein